MSKVLIVGGVAGGMSAAARLRRLDEKSEIVVFERGEYISYANCGLPYYIGEVITERDRLLVQTPASFGKRFNVDIRINSDVLKIDRKKKEIVVKNTKTGKETVEKYDKLILSPGAEPIKPPIPGIENPRIFTLRTVPDTDHIKAYIAEKKPKRALIVGAGFIGLEMAENLHSLGISVTIVEAVKQVMNVIDYEMACIIHQHLRTKGVEFYLSDGVSSFTEDAAGSIHARLNSGRELAFDIVILSIGIRPDNRLAVDAGLEVGQRKGITVDEYLQTSDPNIYAIGDAIEVLNPITGTKGVVPLAGPANKQGRLVADNIVFGNKKKYNGTIGTAIAKVFDLTVGVTGATEKLLEQQKIPFISSIIHPSSHAGYYPNAFPMSVKLVFAPETGKVLGAQVIGIDGVDKRLDVLAFAVQSGKTVADLTEFEHSYAPPYSSAKDPVNMAAFVAENILNGQVNVITWNDILRMDKSEAVYLDVRTIDEFNLGHIESAINIPVDDLRNRMKELPANKKIVVYCGVGLRAYIAARILMQSGFKDVLNLSGGYKTYECVHQKQDNADGYKVGNDDMVMKKDISETNLSIANQIKKLEVNACGLQCPGPILKLKTEIDKLNTGEQMLVKATDPGFQTDVVAWAKATGHKLVSVNSDKGIISATIEKSVKETSSATAVASNDVSIIVFDDDLDRAIASFVIANGAIAMGKKVNMFFTFWGLNVLKKPKKPAGLKKTLIERMFGWMLPSHSKKLKLSQMQMLGIGSAMIRGLMKKKNIDSLESMIQTAIDNGANLIACQMSMDLMGVKKEELLDGVNIGGVATYLEIATRANPNLFI